MAALETSDRFETATRHGMAVILQCTGAPAAPTRGG